MLTALIAVVAMVATVDGGLPVAAPATVGMSAKRLETIDRVVERGIKAGGYPGAAVVVGRKGAAVWEKGFGRTRLGNRPAAASRPTETIYDLASLTKVIGTTTAVMILFDEGRIELDEPVVTYLPEFTGGYKDSVTVRQLLEHRSGLPAGRDLWRIAHTPAEARAGGARRTARVQARPVLRLLRPRRRHPRLHGRGVTGQGLDVFLHERVFAPLGMTNTFFKPADSLQGARRAHGSRPRRAAIRCRARCTTRTPTRSAASPATRDCSAPRRDLSIFAQMMLERRRVQGRPHRQRLHGQAVHHARRRHPRPRLGNGRRSVGLAARFMSEGSFGHAGYTGTSLWIDPDREMFVILLTNRVHAARARQPAKVIADVRADLTDAAAHRRDRRSVADDRDAGVLPLRCGEGLEPPRARESRRNARHSRGYERALQSEGVREQVEVEDQPRTRLSPRSRPSHKKKAS